MGISSSAVRCAVLFCDLLRYRGNSEEIIGSEMTSEHVVISWNCFQYRTVKLTL